MPTAPSLAPARTMKAVTHRRYGGPEVLGLAEVPRPVPAPGEVLVRVLAAGVSIGDHHLVTGKPYLVRLSPFGGLPGPKHPVPGAALAGRVEAVGEGVSGFGPGDEVMGQAAHGAFAEYVALPAAALAPRPRTLSFEEAAAVPWGATAVQGLRDAGGLQPGQRVLINGASGAVGTWAVQVAKALGARVTAVCSTRHLALVRSLGADELVDYTCQDFVQGGARFDVMFDIAGSRSLSECLEVLTPTGTYVACSGSGGDWLGPLPALAGILARSLLTRRKLKVFVMAPRQADLLLLKELVEAGKARPVLERTYPLAEAAEALRQVGEGHSQGLTVLRVAE